MYPEITNYLKSNQGHISHVNLLNIFANKKKDKEKGTLEKLLYGKTKTLKASVTALLDEIKLREKLNIHLINSIERDISYQTSRLSHLQQLRIYYIFERFMEMRKLRLKLENNVLELEKEKRKEELECWHDLMTLRKYLFSSLREYWDLVKRKELLEDKLGRE